MSEVMIGQEEAFGLKEVIGHVAGRTFTPSAATPPASVIVALVVDYVRQHYAEPVSVDQLAEMIGVSKFHLIRKFRRETGMTPGAFLKRYRITRAMEGLVQTGAPVRAIGRQVGYRDAAAFSRAFRCVSGTQPNLYRQTRMSNLVEIS